jgi:hypothetical protein
MLCDKYDSGLVVKVFGENDAKTEGIPENLLPARRI